LIRTGFTMPGRRLNQMASSHCDEQPWFERRLPFVLSAERSRKCDRGFAHDSICILRAGPFGIRSEDAFRVWRRMGLAASIATIPCRPIASGNCVNSVYALPALREVSIDACRRLPSVADSMGDKARPAHGIAA
jgi:hypothetical protein